MLCLRLSLSLYVRVFVVRVGQLACGRSILGGCKVRRRDMALERGMGQEGNVV